MNTIIVLAQSWKEWLTSSTPPFWRDAPWTVVFVAGFILAILLRAVARSLAKKAK
jgi:hypothetical protein